MRYKPVLLTALSAVIATACESSIPPQFASVSTVAVAPIFPGLLVVSPLFVRLPIGGTIFLTTNAFTTSDIEFTSLNPTVATVTQTGLIVGVSFGVATIRSRLFADTNNLAITKVEVVGAVVP